MESLILPPVTSFQKKGEVWMCSYSMIADLIMTTHTDLESSGPPGVGKTLTAEATAEYPKRPLYSVRDSIP